MRQNTALCGNGLTKWFSQSEIMTLSYEEILENKTESLPKNGCCLTLYQTSLTFNDPKQEGFGEHCGKRRKCW